MDRQMHAAKYEAEGGDLDAVKATAEKYGFCLVRDVFSALEVEKIKAGMKEAHDAFGEAFPDLMSCPTLSWLLFDQRILNLARCLLGNELVYYAETNINYEEEIGPLTLSPYSDLHCDATGSASGLWKTWSSPTGALFRAYRFGLYFHDYGTSSGSLKVEVGSHRGDPDAIAHSGGLSGDVREIPYGKQSLSVLAPNVPLYDVPSRAGDVVIWNLRTFHSAGAKRLKLAPEAGLHPHVEKEMYAAMPDAFYPAPGPRIAVFFDYAAPAEETDLYIKNRTYTRAVRSNAPYTFSSYDSAPSLKQAARHGVTLRFDYLIADLAMALRSGTAADVNATANRLMHLLTVNREFSPHFPLFDSARFRREMRTDHALAVRNVVRAVTDTCDRISASQSS